MKILANEIISWIREYAVTNNIKSLVIGVSGGVDSALVSTLCAMTGLPTHCVVMPIYSKEEETDRGELHIDWLKKNFKNVFRHKIDLSQTFSAFTVSLPSALSSGPSKGLAAANAKSRLRMVALYQIATIHGGIVVGTGNKVEDFGVGFFTKYGDGGVDISPIGKLMKSEVRQMCRELDVLPELSEAIPTDGLWDDARTDETQLGATYAELEWAMNYRETPHTLLALTDRQKEVLDIYDKRHKATMHKLLPIPVFEREA